MKYVSLATILFVYCLSGFDAKRSAFDEDLVAYIDYEKYLDNEGQRFRRQVNVTVNDTAVPPPNFGPPNFPLNELPPNFGPPPPNFPPPGLGPGPGSFPENHPNFQHHHHNEGPICADPVNEVYQECGGKCVLGCRYASISADITISKKDCDKNDCVPGCFCKTGLVRHQSKCIPATECPIRKCHRDEVYQCGPAAPITCENVFREHEVIERTKHLDCVWGCYCPKGYLRNSYNGKCVAEGSCRSNKIVDVSPQIPGLFMSRHLFRPPPVAPCFGPQCGCHGPSCGAACYGSTCGSCHSSNCHGKPPSIDIHNHNEAYGGPGYGNTAVNNFHNYGNGLGESYAGGWNGNGNGNGYWNGGSGGYNGYPRPSYSYPPYGGSYPYNNGYQNYPGYYPYPYPGYPGPGVNGTVNGNFDLTLSDEIPDDPVSNSSPRPAIDHYHHWENGVNDAALSGNCIGSNVCNGAGSGVNNKLAGSDPSLNDDTQSDQYEENQDTDSEEVIDDDSIDVNDSQHPNKETESQANYNENESKPSGDETNGYSQNEMTTINSKPQNNQSPQYNNNNQYPNNPFNYYNPIAVIGAAALPANIPFNLPNYFNYQPNVEDSFDHEPETKVETSTRKPNRKNKRPNAQIGVVDDPKKQLHNVLPHNIHQSYNYQSFPNDPNHFEHNYGPNPFAHGQFHTGQSPNSNFGPNPFAQNQFQSGQYPNNNYRPNPLGPNSFGQGQFPSNQFPSNNFGSNQFNPNNPNNQNPQFPYGQFNPHNSPSNFNAQNGPNFPPNYQSFPQFGFQQNGQSLDSPSQSHSFNNPNFPYFGSSANTETLNVKPLKLLTPVPETEDANNKNIKRKPVEDMKRSANSNNCIGENVCNQTR